MTFDETRAEAIAREQRESDQRFYADLRALHPQLVEATDAELLLLHSWAYCELNPTPADFGLWATQTPLEAARAQIAMIAAMRRRPDPEQTL